MDLVKTVKGKREKGTKVGRAAQSRNTTAAGFGAARGHPRISRDRHGDADTTGAAPISGTAARWQDSGCEAGATQGGLTAIMDWQRDELTQWQSS